MIFLERDEEQKLAEGVLEINDPIELEENSEKNNTDEEKEKKVENKLNYENSFS